MKWKTKLRLTIRMLDDLHDPRLPPRSDLPVKPLAQVERTSNDLPSPALISNAMFPEVLVVKGTIWQLAVPHEAASRMRVHAEQEWHEQVMRVPECLVALLSHPIVACRIHAEHAE